MGEQEELLLLHTQGATFEIDVLVAEPEAFALSQTGPGREQDEGSMTFGHCLREVVDGAVRGGLARCLEIAATMPWMTWTVDGDGARLSVVTQPWISIGRIVESRRSPKQG